MRTMPTHYGLAHVERLTLSLHRILEEKLGQPVAFETCCATVARGLSLRGKATYIEQTYIGSPWSSTAALLHLAGLGYVFAPRAALDALQLLERRHIVDRRRVEYAPVATGRREVPKRSIVTAKSLVSKQAA